MGHCVQCAICVCNVWQCACVAGCRCVCTGCLRKCFHGSSVCVCQESVLLCVCMCCVCPCTWQWGRRHSLQTSPLSSVAAGDSCGRCLQWRVDALDGREKQEDWAAQSQGASSVPDPAAALLFTVSFPPPMILTISSPAVCLMNLLLTILVTLSLPPPKPAKAPSPPADTHSGLGSSTPPKPPKTPGPPRLPLESLCAGRATPPGPRLPQTFLKNSWTRPP